MAKHYGLELEGFFFSNGKISVPPKDWRMPVDGFAGLIELRSKVSADIYECYGDIVRQQRKVEDTFDCEIHLLPRHKFSALELQQIRRNTNAPTKERVAAIRNLYNKAPKMLPSGVAIASLQVNISNMRREAHVSNISGTQVRFEDSFGAIDVPFIVRELDNEFAHEISGASRQAGCYAIKDEIRLEYRSLPAEAFNDSFPKRIKELDL